MAQQTGSSAVGALALARANPCEFASTHMSNISDSDWRGGGELEGLDEYGIYELVYSEGGGEGEGEHVDRVYKVTIGTEFLYLRRTGHYDSYNGIDWNNDWAVVYPREVVVTQYFETS